MWRNGRKSRKIAKFGLTDSRQKIFFWEGSPENFKTSFGYSFAGPIEAKEVKKFAPLPIFLGGRGPPMGT